VQFGKNVKLSQFANLYGCEIGDETKIGAFVEVQKNARIGRRCKISSHSFICEGVTIEDNVFVATELRSLTSYPRATTAEGGLQTEKDWNVETTVVKRGASIGSGATILCRVVIGENAIVGAGSVVTRDVPPTKSAGAQSSSGLQRHAEWKLLCNSCDARKIEEDVSVFPARLWTAPPGIIVGRHITSYHAPRSDNRVLADDNSAQDVAPEPMEAPRFTTVVSTFQSFSVWSPPSAVVARGYESLMNVTPWPQTRYLRSLRLRI